MSLVSRPHTLSWCVAVLQNVCNCSPPMQSPSMQTRNRGRGQAGSPSRGRGQTSSQSRGRGQVSMGRGRASSPSSGCSSPAPDKLNGDELFLCRSLVRELERQPQAMPFRYPVSKKQVRCRMTVA